MDGLDWDKYIEWAKGVTGCSICKDLKEQLDNANFNDDYKRGPYPFPGYVGENYQPKRILILGMNPGPGGGKENKNSDDPNYGIYSNLISDLEKEKDPKEKEELIKRAMQELQKQVKKWNCIKKLRFNGERGPLFGYDQLGMNNVAYSNQVLCRTKERISHLGTKVARSLYANCYVAHMKELLNILKPNLIIAFGKLGKGIGQCSWEQSKWLNILKKVECGMDKEWIEKIIPIYHPCYWYFSQQDEIDAMKTAIQERLEQGRNE